MNKYHWIIIAAIISLLIEIGVLGRFFAPYGLTLFIPLMFIVAASFKIEEGLIVALSCGFLLDISTLSRVPFWSIFLTLQILAISFAQKKLIDMKNNFSLLLFALIINLIGLVARLIVFGARVFDLQLLFSLLLNFLLSATVLLVWFSAIKRQKF